MKRRVFIGTAVAGAGVGASCRTHVSPWRFLTEAEARTLEAWAECLIPADQDPGARDADVVRYIDTQLTGFFKRDRMKYRGALEAMEIDAKRTHGRGFTELGMAEQTTLLENIEAGRGEKEVWGQDGGKGAFEMVLNHTLQGFYGNPRHGGNRNYASWKMLGVSPVQVRGRLHYSFEEKS